MRLTRAQIEAMYEHARAAYPEECCGLIVGPPRSEERNGTSSMRLFPCRNVQNEMHERDPEAYPRTARRAYLIDPFEFERIFKEADAEGEVLRGIFHSHPDEDAYFSQEDKDAAVPFGDIPSFPDAEHIVMSVRGSEVLECKVFIWNGVSGDYTAGELEVSDGVSS